MGFVDGRFPLADGSGAPPAALLDEIVRRIVEGVRPRRIVLFGSAARGRMGPHSDIDLLVVMPDGVHRGRTAAEIYRLLWGVRAAKDVVVVTEGDVRERGEDPSLVIGEALRNGRELYRGVG